MTAIGQAVLLSLIGQLLVHVSALNMTQCLEGQGKENLTITCFSTDTPYIEIKNVTMGSVPLANGCDNNATKSQCCEMTGACHYNNKTLLEELYKMCSGNSICKKDAWSTSLSEVYCDIGKYSPKANYIVVEYECLNKSPLTTTTTTPAPTSNTTAAPTLTSNTTLTVHTTTLIYSSNLTMGEQAAIICCIMLFLFLIGTVVVIYKRIKYGPPEDVRKLFSRPAPPSSGNESPGVVPWLPGEAQGQVYQTLAENKLKKKKKLKFPKFKF